MPGIRNATLAICTACVCLCSSVQAQNYPAQAIRLLVGAPPGGGADPAQTTIGQYNAFIQCEYSKWGRVIDAAGIKGE